MFELLCHTHTPFCYNDLLVIAVVANVTHTRGCFYRHTTINLTSTMTIQTPVSGKCDNVGLHCVSKVLSSVRQM